MLRLTSLPVQLVLSIILAFLLGQSLSTAHVSLFYTASSCFIDLLLFMLPFMVFGLIFLATLSAEKKSLILLLVIFLGVFASNFLALFAAYLFSSLTLPSIAMTSSISLTARAASEVKALFALDLPTLLSTDKAMLLAMVLAQLWCWLPQKWPLKPHLHSAVSWLNGKIHFLLTKIFIPLLPLYVFGFCLKLSHDNTLASLFASYGKVFLLSMTLVSGYIFFLYYVGSGLNLNRARQNLKTMTPAALTAFSTMSSAATMPITLKCTQEMTKDQKLTNLIIPSTANIHMLGDDLTIVMTAMAMLTLFGMPQPDLISFGFFASAFCVAKLSCVGVPGASVLVILPVLTEHLHFTPEMITFLTTIYILQDSFGTTANVLGNGAFSLILQNILKRFMAIDRLFAWRGR